VRVERHLVGVDVDAVPVPKAQRRVAGGGVGLQVEQEKRLGHDPSGRRPSVASNPGRCQRMEAASGADNATAVIARRVG
jgi:hypothetical protein